MENKKYHYIAIDISKSDLEVRTQNHRCSLSNNPTGFKALVKIAGRQDQPLVVCVNRTEKSGHGILLFLWLWVGFRFGKRLLGCPPWGAKIFFHLNRVFVAQGGMLAKAVVE